MQMPHVHTCGDWTAQARHVSTFAYCGFTVRARLASCRACCALPLARRAALRLAHSTALLVWWLSALEYASSASCAGLKYHCKTSTIGLSELYIFLGHTSRSRRNRQIRASMPSSLVRTVTTAAEGAGATACLEAARTEC